MVVQTVLGDRCCRVIVRTQAELHPAQVVSRDLDADCDDLADVVAASNDAVRELSACFVLARLVAPRVATNATTPVIQVVLHLHESVS